MGKMIVVVLGIAALAFGVYRALEATAATAAKPTGTYEPSQPKRQLDNVRAATRRIESQQQQQVDHVTGTPQE